MLQLENVYKCFARGTSHETEALRGINLNIPKEDFVTVIGSNGAGKSTLLNIIAGTVLPDKGKVKIDGCEFSNKAEYFRARFIGRVFQDPLLGTSPSMTVEENLSLAMKRFGRGLHFGLN